MESKELIKILKQYPGYSVGVNIDIRIQPGQVLNFTKTCDIKGLLNVSHLDKTLDFDLED